MPKRKLPILTVILGALFLLKASYLVYDNYFSAKTVWKDTGELRNEVSAHFDYVSQLDGRGVATKEEESPQVIGVMIDNHPDSLPQAGLAAAKIVYEAPAEGGLTRFLAIFEKNQTVEKAGPVRSARPYFLDWLREYGDGLYMHCGGSPEALGLIKTENIFDANEFYWGRYYWRDEARSAPHNLYTSNEKWQALLGKYAEDRPDFASILPQAKSRILDSGEPESGPNRGSSIPSKRNREKPLDWIGWKFAPPAFADPGFAEGYAEARATAGKFAANFGEPVKEIKIKYFFSYAVVWKYNGQNKNYERWVNNSLQVDENGTPITASNVLLQYTNIQILDDIGRRQIDTVGQGKSTVLNGGGMTRGSWKKDSVYSRTKFFNDKNEEVALVPGNTWVEVVPNDVYIEITN